jgi:hypothetical protein
VADMGTDDGGAVAATDGLPTAFFSRPQCRPCRRKGGGTAVKQESGGALHAVNTRPVLGFRALHGSATAVIRPMRKWGAAHTCVWPQNIGKMHVIHRETQGGFQIENRDVMRHPWRMLLCQNGLWQAK